jgi:hypothetical protein
MGFGGSCLQKNYTCGILIQGKMRKKYAKKEENVITRIPKFKKKKGKS